MGCSSRVVSQLDYMFCSQLGVGSGNFVEISRRQAESLHWFSSIQKEEIRGLFKALFVQLVVACVHGRAGHWKQKAQSCA